MCTLIILYKTVPCYPVIVAGNRDEFLTRKSLPPHLWEEESQGGAARIFAGKDLEAGGTWFGINQYGVVAGLTNRHTGSRDASKSSRGRIVLKCLSQSSPDFACGVLRAEDTSRYNPFNLFCLDRTSGFLLTNFPEPRILKPLEPGIHLLTNEQLGDPEDPKAGRVHQELKDPPEDVGRLEDLLTSILRHHGAAEATPPLCIHLPGYGTVSSSILFWADRIEESRFLFRAGAPCEGPYQDLSRGLVTLLETGHG